MSAYHDDGTPRSYPRARRTGQRYYHDESAMDFREPEQESEDEVPYYQTMTPWQLVAVRSATDCHLLPEDDQRQLSLFLSIRLEQALRKIAVLEAQPDATTAALEAVPAGDLSPYQSCDRMILGMVDNLPRLTPDAALSEAAREWASDDQS